MLWFLLAGGDFSVFVRKRFSILLDAAQKLSCCGGKAVLFGV